MVGVVWQPLVYGWQFGIPSYAFVFPGGTVTDVVALDLCDATSESLMPERTAMSLEPELTSASLMSRRTAEPYCEP